jgi:hypothetical protein
MRNIQRVLYLLMVLFLAAGCAEHSRPSTESIAASQLMPSTTLIPAAAFTPSLTTFTPSASTITPTRTPTIVPTPTQLPEIRQQIIQLFEPNPECQLPCWWGIVPGESTWDYARRFLEPISYRISDAYIYSDLPGLVNYTIVVPLPVNQYTPWSKDNQIYVVDTQTDIIKAIYAPAEDFEQYQIPNLLETYGPPVEILFSGGHGFGDKYFVSLYMYYPAYGFLATHITTVAWEDTLDGFVSACYHESSELFIWPPDQTMSYEDMVPFGMTDFTEITMELFQEFFQSLNMVTGFDEAGFYYAFVNSELPVCIDVQTQSWFMTQ